MEIWVNDEPLELERAAGDSVGDLLSKADALIEKAGAVIVAVSRDGVPVDPDRLPELGAMPATGPGRLDIKAEPASDYRARAIDILLGILESAPPFDEAERRGKLRDSLATLSDGIGGLFPADELGYIRGLAEAAAEARSGTEGASRLAERAAGLAAIFRERLAELREPETEFRRAAAVYRGAAEELRELPVWLQTGKEKQAMQAVLVFVELFNKVIRLMPELGRRGVDANAIRIEGQDLPSFYASFNGVLKDLAKAIEDHDSVLIGDLSEYEVAPRMEGLFAAIGGALPA